MADWIFAQEIEVLRMAVSEEVLRRRDEAIELFKEAFPAPAFEVRIRSPKRKGGDREFLLNRAGKNIAGIHVKKDSFKMYLADELVARSKNKDKYERLNGGQFIHFETAEDCLAEIKDTI